MTVRNATRTRLDPALRREQILEAAERVFQTRDPVEVTFEELARAAGVSRALVYNYFGDKGGLVAAVYLRSLHRLHQELDEAVDPDAPAAERLRASVRCYLGYAAENSAGWRLMGATAGFDHPDVRRVRRTRFEGLARNWGDGTDARIMARGVIGFLEGATMAWIEAGSPDIERVADRLYLALWQGLSSVQAPPRPATSKARQQYQAATLR
jgi:AcrR family transcriptional regulator